VFSTRDHALQKCNPGAHTNNHEKKEKTAAPTVSKSSGEFGFEGAGYFVVEPHYEWDWDWDWD
jgi:hypothetical protein